jgi:uracil-DNA glycosylase family 4
VPGFGDPRARLVLVGLAPGAHGANRTGRMFTGDRSGDFLYAALHRAGLASQAESRARDDGLVLEGAFITAPVRCAPPDNAPSPAEIAACARWFRDELALLPDARAFLALGAIAWAALHRELGATPAPRFAHGAESALADGRPVVASYHVSQQNTQTGRLTPSMFDRALLRALALAQLPASDGGVAAPGKGPRSRKSAAARKQP